MTSKLTVKYTVASKEIKITDDFSIPVSGSIILNPEQEQFYVVIGFSL